MSAWRPTSASGSPWYTVASDRFVELVPEHVERLGWSADDLRAHQERLFADLVRTAVASSPFHRRRLDGIGPTSIGLDEIGELPVMTKQEMMSEFDSVCTDRRLTRSLVEAHLASLDDEPELLVDEYVVIASGGSSGTRGVYVLSVHDAVDFSATLMRPGLARLIPVLGWPPRIAVPLALIVAPKAIHATRALSPVAAAMATMTYAPATLPIEEIIDRLQAAQPMIVLGYPSVLAALADAASEGRLAITPQMVLTTSEERTEDHAARIMRGFGVAPANTFGSSEGLIGSAPPGSDEFTFASDRCIVEFVDVDDNPVPVGTAAHHVLVTNLVNHVQPLIRFRMDDVMIELPPDPLHGHQRAVVSGRNDELMSVGGVEVHPLAVRSALLTDPAIIEYQVTTSTSQLGRPGIEIAIVTRGPADVDRVAGLIADALGHAGVGPADVAIRVVANLDRHPGTGKVRRFVNQ